MYKIKLVVYLKDGRELSGSYPYLECLARLQWARGQQNYLGFDLLEAC